MWLAMLSRASDSVGLTGVGCILLAYYLLNAGRIDSKSLMYQMVNFVGAWLILFSLFFHWNTASVVIEISWISISTMGMYKIYRSRQAVRTRRPLNDQVISSHA